MLTTSEYARYLIAVNEIFGLHRKRYKNTNSPSHAILDKLSDKIEAYQTKQHANQKAIQAKNALLSKLSRIDPNSNNVLKFTGGRTKKTRRAKKSKRSTKRR